jgi:hypothetical protein
MLGLAAPGLLAAAPTPGGITLISPGCRRTKVRVGKLYLGMPGAHWPTPKLDLKAEVQAYEQRFAQMGKELADVEFVGNDLVSSGEQLAALKPKLQDVDGILAIHLSMGIGGILNEIVALQRPTMLFAAPYSGHEWVGYGGLRQRPEGALVDCMLTADYTQLAVAVRPFRAIHHLREAKILDVTTRDPGGYIQAVKDKFGTEIKVIGRERVLAAYEAVPDDEARLEARQWLRQAKKVVEPPEEEVVKSCKLALAFERLLAEEDATVITVDCYGTMWRQLPAYPCIGFTRLNNMGLGGICESDLRSAMTYVLFQGLTGRPGFISDPTVDESQDAIILAHCMGTTKMDGPDGPAAPYKLRTIMERQEGAVCQVKMRLGQQVTQVQLVGTDTLLYFTGEIIDTPDLERGCRTKITVKVDGDIHKLWHNWSSGLHRVTCYGDLTEDLQRFCRFKQLNLVNEV